MLELEDVSHVYSNGTRALDHVTLSIPRGMFGLLGPNGAGKSTLMRNVATLQTPTEGRIRFGDIDVIAQPEKLRRTLGYLPQDFGVYRHLNAVEFLEYMAAVKGVDARSARGRIDELLQLVNLVDAARRPVGGYSGGMKQRVGIAQALLNDPQLLIVDEPTAGLDPEERVRFRGLLTELSGERIVILSTHIVSDVEATATSIAIINKGYLVTYDLPEAILQAVEGKVWTWIVASSDLPAIKQQYLISSTARRSDGVHVRVVADHRPNGGAEPVPATLEDAYLYLTHQAQGHLG